MLRYVPEWKITNREAQEFIPASTPGIIREAARGEIKSLEDEPGRLKIKKMIDRKEEQQAFAVQSISENHTRQEKKTQAE